METIKLKDYEVHYSDKFFFDTNIWLLLFGSVANLQAKDQRQYSALFEKLILHRAPIYITSMVVSEFANVLLRRDFKQWASNNRFVGKDFKRDYVGTPDYANSVQSITISINKIFKLPNIFIVSDDFNAVDKNAILNNFKTVDFNDAYFTQLSVLNNYKIVTNDKDFKKLVSNVEIITTQV